MKTKRVPLRMCLGCGEMFPKKDLIRVVHNKEGETMLDFTGRAAGRGAYLCRNAGCLRKMQKTKRLERAFETQIPEDVYDRLEKELSADEG